MSCCPPAPIKLQASSDTSTPYGEDSAMVRGESVECYGKNSPNPTGLYDDATGNVPNKIKNTSVTVNCNASVNETFSLGNAANTMTAATWEMRVNGSISGGFTGVPFTSSGTTATLIGTFTEADFKSITIEITAKTSGGDEIDVRSFTFAPAKCVSSDTIKLLNPLPGSIVNSKFGPRIHPISGIQKMHTGIDMKFSDRSVADVQCAADGEVLFAGNTGNGYGNAVHVKHTNGAGNHLCTTTYNHLAKVYVSKGQKVSASQRLGLEGTTGASTGNHLHFEVKLPNGTFVDPLPYISGEVTAADITKPNGDAETTSLNTTTNTNTELTSSNVKAKEADCKMGDDYANPNAMDATPTPPDPTTDPFEQAWSYAMKHEVGAFWDTSATTSPDDPDVSAGRIETADQRKRVGFTNTTGDKGGTTKFGVSQNANRTVDVPEMDYADAKQIGYNNYWKPNSTSVPGLIGIMLFDISYLHGSGGAKRILNASGANLAASDLLPECAKIRDSQIAYCEAIVRNNPPQSKFLNGWKNRANALYNYVASL